MINHLNEATITVSLKELDILIRRAVREELTEIASVEGGVFYIDPGTPLHHDLKDISASDGRSDILV